MHKIKYFIYLFILSLQQVVANDQNDPLHQFDIYPLISFHLFGFDLSVTNATLFMFGATFLLCLFGYKATHYSNQKTGVPSRIGYIFEYGFNFVSDLIQGQTGKDGLSYMPYIFCLFLFILTMNLVGMIPYAFTVTSHFSITFTLALLVFISTIVISIRHNGWSYGRTFFPSGVPLYIAPILVPIEIISYFARPFSLAIRLCANMVAGHIIIKVFASFVNFSTAPVLSIFPLLMNVGLTGFEILVAFLQAYVFIVLTCIYLNDALHLH